MQTTFTASIVKEQDNYPSIIQALDKVSHLHNLVEHKLYAEIISILQKNKTKQLNEDQLNTLKSIYQDKYLINARQFNSIHATLKGKISSVMELNKSYLIDAKDNLISLTKSVKSKNKILSELNTKLADKNYIPKPIDKTNIANLQSKLYYLNQKLDKAKAKVSRLEQIEKSGNPEICFGSNKLFRQQFLIGTDNNKTQFKTHDDWKKAWVDSRNKTFFYIGSSDETAGNQNCQIKHIANNIFELEVNVYPKATKLSDRYIKFQ